MVNDHKGCYFFVFLHGLIRHVFKMSAFGTCVFWLVNATGQWMCQLCVVQCLPQVYLHNWKESVMKQTKYCNNVIMTSVLGNKNKQKLVKQMSDNIKHIILANMNVKLYSWPRMFRKVLWQQLWEEVVVVISSFSTDLFWI